MSDLAFAAERRTILGKQVKQLRRAGRIPGIVYGPAIRETVPVTVERRSFDRFYNATGHSTLFTLRWDGGQQAVFIREVQLDPVRHDSLHIDFFAPRLDQPVRAVVPVVLHHLSGDAEGVLTQLRTDVELESLPALMPHQIDADLSGLLAVGDALHVSDLPLPEGVTAVTAEDDLIAQLSAETVEEPAEGAAEEAAEDAGGAEEGADKADSGS
jgi:large subunit ribosomal protein L25